MFLAMKEAGHSEVNQSADASRQRQSLLCQAATTLIISACLAGVQDLLKSLHLPHNPSEHFQRACKIPSAQLPAHWLPFLFPLLFHVGNSFLLQRFEIKKASLQLTASIFKLFYRAAGVGRDSSPKIPALLSDISESGSGNCMASPVTSAQRL